MLSQLEPGKANSWMYVQAQAKLQVGKQGAARHMNRVR